MVFLVNNSINLYYFKEISYLNFIILNPDEWAGTSEEVREKLFEVNDQSMLVDSYIGEPHDFGGVGAVVQSSISGVGESLLRSHEGEI